MTAHERFNTRTAPTIKIYADAQHVSGTSVPPDEPVRMLLRSSDTGKELLVRMSEDEAAQLGLKLLRAAGREVTVGHQSVDITIPGSPR